MKRLPTEKVMQAYTLVVDEGYSHADAAKVVGIGVETVARIVRGERYSEITQQLAVKMVTPVKAGEIQDSVKRLLDRIAQDAGGE